MEQSTLECGYRQAAEIPSDINEHVPTFRFYAAKCDDVVEMGVRSGISTWGFLQGLADAGATDTRPRTLTGYDLSVAPAPYQFASVQHVNELTLRFHQANVLNIAPVSCDLLFIDTFHVYGQLKRELALHASGTRRFIIMHDTTVDEFTGEALRQHFDIPLTTRSTGIPEDELSVGLGPAIAEFVNDHPEWNICERFTHNNGLTILERL